MFVSNCYFAICGSEINKLNSEKQVNEISSMNSYKSLGENGWDKPLGETQDKPSWSDTKTPEVSPGCSV